MVIPQGPSRNGYVAFVGFFPLVLACSFFAWCRWLSKQQWEKTGWLRITSVGSVCPLSIPHTVKFVCLQHRKEVLCNTQSRFAALWPWGFLAVSCRAYLDSDVAVSEELIQKYSNVVLGHVNGTVRELRRLFLVDDLVDSLKVSLPLWGHCCWPRLAQPAAPCRMSSASAWVNNQVEFEFALGSVWHRAGYRELLLGSL